MRASFFFPGVRFRNSLFRGRRDGLGIGSSAVFFFVAIPASYLNVGSLMV